MCAAVLEVRKDEMGVSCVIGEKFRKGENQENGRDQTFEQMKAKTFTKSVKKPIFKYSNPKSERDNVNLLVLIVPW